MRPLPPLLLLSFCLMSLPAPLQAQSSGNAAGMSPATQQGPAPGVPAPHELNVPDRVFFRAATVGGLAEVDFGQLAGTSGQSQLIKTFANRMVSDHGKANRQLAALAAADQFPVPSKLDLEHQRLREDLQKLSGEHFDRVYLQSQIQDHQRTAQLLAYEIGAGENADLKAFAEGTLPIVLMHLQMAQDIATKLWNVAPQGAAPGMAMGQAQP